MERAAGVILFPMEDGLFDIVMYEQYFCVTFMSVYANMI